MTTSQREATRSAAAGRAGRRLGARDLALIAVFTALIVVLGMPGPLFAGSPVPITLQTLGVMLAPALLGARRGALVSLTLLVLVAVGLPVLAGGRGGLAVFAGPSMGYLIGFVPGAFVIGYLVERLRRLTPLTILGAVLLGGIVVIHLCGIPVMMWRAHLSLGAALVADAAFLPGDLIKAVLAAVTAAGVHRARPDLLPRRTRG